MKGDPLSTLCEVNEWGCCTVGRIFDDIFMSLCHHDTSNHVRGFTGEIGQVTIGNLTQCLSGWKLGHDTHAPGTRTCWLSWSQCCLDSGNQGAKHVTIFGAQYKHDKNRRNLGRQPKMCVVVCLLCLFMDRTLTMLIRLDSINKNWVANHVYNIWRLALIFVNYAIPSPMRRVTHFLSKLFWAVYACYSKRIRWSAVRLTSFSRGATILVFGRKQGERRQLTQAIVSGKTSS